MLDPEKERAAAKAAMLDMIRRHTVDEKAFFYVVISTARDKGLTVDDLWEVVHGLMPPGGIETAKAYAAHVSAEFRRGYRDRAAELRRMSMKKIDGGKTDEPGTE